MKIISGLPRSGTSYTAVLLNELGIPATHESQGAASVDVSWWYMAREIDKVDMFIVRNPSDVMSSLTTINPESWRWLTKNVGVNEEEIRFRAIETTLRWHRKMFETRKPLVRVETLGHWTGLALLFKGLGIERRPTDGDVYTAGAIPKNVNSRYHTKKKITNALETKRGRMLRRELAEVKRRLGYQTHDVPPDEKFEQRVARIGEHLMFYPQDGTGNKGMQVLIEGKRVPMRKLAMFYKTGVWPEDGKVFKAVCGEKWCVNPEHLVELDNKEKVKLMNKGRMRYEAKLRGEW